MSTACPTCAHAVADHDDHGCNRCRCGHGAECSCQGCGRARKAAKVAQVEGLRAQVAMLTEENAILQRGIEHTRYWYGARFARLHALATERGWDEVFAVMANGVTGPDDPPTLQQMYNTERGRAKAAEKLAINLSLYAWHCEACPRVKLAETDPSPVQCACGFTEYHLAVLPLRRKHDGR